MTQTVGGQQYFHPSDFEIDDAPYPVWQRMRDALPLYHHEKYGFCALSRSEGVARELTSCDDYRSGKGTIIEVILKASLPARS